MFDNSVYLARIGAMVRIRLESMTGKKIKGEYFSYKVMKDILCSEDLFRELAEEIKANHKVEITDNYELKISQPDLWNFTPSDDYCENFENDFSNVLDVIVLAQDKKFEEDSSIINDDDIKIITSLSSIQIANHVRFIVNSWYYFFNNLDLTSQEAMDRAMLTFVKCHFHELFEEINVETILYLNRVLKLNSKTRCYDFTKIKHEYLGIISKIGLKS